MRARGSGRLRRPANVREDARRFLAPSVLLRLALGLALVLWVVIPAGVLMDAFASADTTTGASTTGTASTVSPSTIAVGGSLAYTLSGFPPSSTVEVLVDDGGLVQQDSSDAGVVARISVSEDGTFSGAVELPVYVTEGTHWLRFRAVAGADVPTSQIRTLDYTNKSPFFTVGAFTVIGGAPVTVAPDPTTGEPTPVGPDVGTDPASHRAADTPSPTPAATPSPTPAATPSLQYVPADTSAAGVEMHATEVRQPRFPVIGASLLGIAAILSGLAVAIVLRRRRMEQDYY